MFKASENGRPQGSILSPVLFSTAINDLVSKIFTFCLWESGSNVKQLEHLCQNCLTKVYKWSIESDS